MIQHIFFLLDKPDSIECDEIRAAYRSGIVRGLVMGICSLAIGGVAAELILYFWGGK